MIAFSVCLSACDLMFCSCIAIWLYICVGDGASKHEVSVQGEGGMMSHWEASMRNVYWVLIVILNGKPWKIEENSKN